jgi:outer membrane protein OmpA-like peptidoglycan-associated protein
MTGPACNRVVASRNAAARNDHLPDPAVQWWMSLRLGSAPVALAAVLVCSCGGKQEPAPPAPAPTSNAGPVAVATGDRDSDGVPDATDKCPGAPEDLDGFEDENGCPDPDNDSDRFPDVDDGCPDEPETYNAKDDEDGCSEKCVIVLVHRIEIIDRLHFALGDARIGHADKSLLDKMVVTLNGNPQIDLIQVAGHASDDEGSRERKIYLSRTRAATVVDAFVARGVAKERLSAAGYGDLCPKDEGVTPEARTENRRVEFEILSVDGRPTGSEITCQAAKELIPEADLPYAQPPDDCDNWPE